MATYVFQSITAEQAAAFNPATDFLVFQGEANAAAVQISGDSSSVSFSFGGKTVTLPVALAAVVGSGAGSFVSFANGSDLIVGDNTSSVVFDQLAQTVAAPARYSQVWGLEGSDTISASRDSVIYGNQGADSVDAAAGIRNATVFGGQGDDTITSAASAGSNVLYGNLGNDSVTAASADTVFGGQGNDTITGAADAVVFGNLGDDSITAVGGDNVIYGNQGSDTLTGSAGNNDTLYGGQDNDVFVAGGANILYGNLGDDTFTSVAAATIYGGQGADSIDADTGALARVFAGEGADTILGGSGSVLFGEGGDDVFVYAVAFGADTVVGGAGNDTLIANGSDVTVGADVLEVESFQVATSNHLNLGALTYGANASVTATGAATITGSAFADTLTGGDGADTLIGGAGNDVINGGAGADTIDGGAGADIISGAAGDDVIVGGAGADTIYAGLGADTVNGGAGIDVIYLGDDLLSDVVILDQGTADNYAVVNNFRNGDVLAIDVSEFATINLTVGALLVGEYNEIAAAGALAADSVNVITTAAGYADYATAFAAVTATGAGDEVFVGFFNSASGKFELYFDADGSNATGAILVAQLDVVGTDVVNLANTNFAVI